MKSYLIACTVCGLRFVQSEDEPDNSGCYACGSSLAKVEEINDEKVVEILRKYGQRESESPDSL